MKPIILIKIGGSLITDKNKAFTVNEKALDKICREIKRVKNITDKQLVIGHGAGSFAHFTAKKYQRKHGYCKRNNFFGMADIQNSAAKLNRIIIEKLLKLKVPAISINPSTSYISDNDKLKSLDVNSLKESLKLGLLPVLYGDVIFDASKDYTIFSTEKVLGFLAEKLLKEGYKVEMMIQCGQTNGVYDEKGQTIPEITEKNFKNVKSSLTGSSGIDVTGGMIHKVEESLSLAKKGVKVLIIDGVEKGSLVNAIKGKKVLGTIIK